VKPLIIFGAGEQAEVAHYYFVHDVGVPVRAFTVDPEFVGDGTFVDLPVLPFSEIERHFAPEEHDLFVALGYTRLNALRAERCAQAKAKNYRLASYVSRRASIWPGLEVGENCFILEDNTIQPFVRIGNNVTLWSGNHVGHHSRIGDNCFVTSHVVISGGVSVGDNCFLGVNATIRDHISIGRFSVIGAGALITADVPEHGVMIQAGAELSKVPSSRLRKL
jgi:sugar O-acyltransferase (sialic acid O-acetyltransferase NeuD family)